MNMNLKKLMGPVALSLVAFTGILNAADDTKMQNLNNRVSALEQKKGAGGMINPPARPVLREGTDIFISGEVLVWKAHQDDMGYAIKLAQTPVVGNRSNSGQFADWKGKWAAGFRLGLGYNMCHDGWDTDLIWTRFHTKSYRNSAGDRHGIFSPTYVVAPNTSVFGDTTAEAHNKQWKLNLDMVDLELGREFFVSKWLTIRPHAGVRYALVRQRFGVEYEDGNYATNVLANPQGSFLTGARESFVTMKNNFWGVGLRAGLDSQWGMGSGFSLYGKMALSVLWGQQKVRENNTIYNTGRTSSVLANNFSNLYHVCKPVADIALGLRYDHAFSDDAYSLGILAGWEHHYFWSQNKLFRFFSTPYGNTQNSGDLSTSGVNVGLLFDF